jgi:hypothetical protein
VDTQGAKATEREQDDTHEGHGVWVTDEEIRGRIKHGDRLFIPATVVIVNGQVMVQLPHVDGVPDRMFALHREWFGDDVVAAPDGKPERRDLALLRAALRESSGDPALDSFVRASLFASVARDPDSVRVFREEYLGPLSAPPEVTSDESA